MRKGGPARLRGASLGGKTYTLRCALGMWLAPSLLRQRSGGGVVMTESVTASLAAGIIAVVVVVMAIARAVKQR